MNGPTRAIGPTEMPWASTTITHGTSARDAHETSHLALWATEGTQMIVLESKYVTTFAFVLLCSVPACVSACVCGTFQTGNAPELVINGQILVVVCVFFLV